MAEVFISYRNTPERRALVSRLAVILRAHAVTVWWDYGLEAGESYRSQITTELANARVVAPLWCAESVNSKWVRMEAELGKDKLVPARLQKVAPPDAFEAIQAADLIGWDGAVGNQRVLGYVRRICERLGRVAIVPTDTIDELAHLPPVPPLPEVLPAVATLATTAAGPYEFWDRQWEKYGTSDNLTALHDIADEAPRIFANQARARIAEIEAARQSQTKEQKRPRVQKVPRADEAPPKPGTRFRDFGIGPDMIVVPAGEFMMGSAAGEGDDDEHPQHEVAIARPFAVGIAPVTRGEFAAFVRETNHEMAIGADPGFTQQDDHPVVCVNWHDAWAYAAWLGERSAKSYRLLSEAEWEYCCRAGTVSRYVTGDHITAERANFGTRAGGTMAVSRFPPNPWGLFDMHGNVWEWCEDNWHLTYKGAPRDGSAWKGGEETLRVLRGGSWDSSPQDLRSAYRGKFLPVSRAASIGFRVARTLQRA